MPSLSREIFKSDIKRILAGDTEKNLEVSQFELMAINSIANLVGLEVTSLDGVTTKYNVREIEHLARQMNDLVTGGEVVTYAYDELFIFPLGNTSRVLIETDGTASEVYLM